MTDTPRRLADALGLDHEAFQGTPGVDHWINHAPACEKPSTALEDIRAAVDQFRNKTGSPPAVTVVPGWMWEELEREADPYFIELRDRGAIQCTDEFYR